MTASVASETGRSAARDFGRFDFDHRQQLDLGAAPRAWQVAELPQIHGRILGKVCGARRQPAFDEAQ